MCEILCSLATEKSSGWCSVSSTGSNLSASGNKSLNYLTRTEESIEQFARVSNWSSSPNTITCRANNLISTDAFLINRSTLILNPLLCKSLNFSLLHLWLQNHCDISMHIGKNPSGVKFNSPLRQTWNFLWHTPYHYTQVKG